MAVIYRNLIIGPKHPLGFTARKLNTTRAVAVLDDALSLVQRAGALLNAVHVEDSKKDPSSPEPTGFKGTRDDKDGSAAKPNLSRTVSSVN